MKHPLTLHKHTVVASGFNVRDADDVWVGTINSDGHHWRIYHPVERGKPSAPSRPFESIDAAFAAFEATP